MYPKIGTLANALETVKAEKANRPPLPDDWEAPDPVFQKWQLVHAFHYSQQVVQRTDEQFGGDMLTHEYWKNWVENRLFQDAQEDAKRDEAQSGRQAAPRRMTRAQIDAQRPWLAHSGHAMPDEMPVEAIADLLGVEVIDDPAYDA